MRPELRLQTHFNSFPFLTPPEHTHVCMCAHSLSNSWASTTHWQSERTAPKILEVHSAYDVNEATAAITKHVIVTWTGSMLRPKLCALLGGSLCMLFLLGDSDSQAPSHYNNVFWESLHFGHFKAAQLAIKVQHPFVHLPDLTESTMRTWQPRRKRSVYESIQTNHWSFSCPLTCPTFMNYKHFCAYYS